MRDSADVASSLAENWLPLSLCSRIRAEFDGSPSLRDAVDDRWIWALAGFLGGSHDCGKAVVSFAAQVAEHPQFSWLWEQVRNLPGTPNLPRDPTLPRHATFSDLILRRWFHRRFPEANASAIFSLTSIVGAHHGVPSAAPTVPAGSSESLNKLERHLDAHGQNYETWWFELIDDICERTSAKDVLDSILKSGGLSVSSQMALAGLVTMADWIASNQELFPLTETGKHSSDYSRAEQALEQLNLPLSWIADTPGIPPFHERFSWPAGHFLRPCQQAVVEVLEDCDSEPKLVVIEAETGEGKTEASLIAAEMIAATTGAGGVVLALPSMATADASFERFVPWVDSVSRDEQTVHSVFLGHSRSLLNESYEELRRVSQIQNLWEHEKQAESSVTAHQWLAGRKRGLLSEFAVCTIDQVLMMGLSTKYVNLRHLGLAGKVVILDEVHSFDAYSSSYICKSLEWLAAHGASVIMLSATLASQQCDEFASAFKRGLEGRAKPRDRISSGRGENWWQCAVPDPSEGIHQEQDSERPPSSFPRVTLVTENATTSRSFDSLPGNRDVHVKMADDGEISLRKLLSEVTADGGVIGIVCNTVERAQLAFRIAQSVVGNDKVELLHSHFTASDRSVREAAIVRELGPSCTRNSGRPTMKVVVGTQVLEQSLDIDFDLLISDVAPIDSLAQRAGRLHRHYRTESDRPKMLREATIILRGVCSSTSELNTRSIEDLSVPEFESGTQAIYGTRVLLASLASLLPYLAGKVWSLRHGVAPLVEAVYSSPESFSIPLTWRSLYQAALQEEREKYNESVRRAEAFQLKSPKDSRGRLELAFKGGSAIDVDASKTEICAQAQVRDVEPSIEVILLRRLPQGITLLPGHGNIEGEIALISELIPPDLALARNVAASVLRLPRWLVPPWKIDCVIAELEKKGIPSFQGHYLLKGVLTLEVDEQLNGELLGTKFHYSTAQGLERIVNNSGEDGQKK